MSNQPDSLSNQPDSFNILIVDDNKNNLFTLRNLIGEHIVGVNIFQAISGMSALEILLQEKMDLILLDVQMPDMDGFETATLIQTRKKTQHIPIVFLTAAFKSEEFKQRGFAVGAADYLTKPIDAPQLISRIKSYLRFIQQERQHKQDLEQKVQERTAALLETNQRLEQEIHERQQIQDKLKKAHDELEQRVAERTAELSQTNAQLLEAKETAESSQKVAEAANLAKSRFLANMSHELRTPLNAIIGYSEMLQEDAEDSGQADFLPDLRKIHSAGKHLLNLISDVLDISKLEAGKMELYLETFDLTTLINSVVASVQPLMEKNDNKLEVRYNKTLGQIYADLTKLRQILLNLLSNSAKFTERGNITLEIVRHTREEDEWIIFCVCDDGIGMTLDQQDKLFQPFTQADTSPTRKYGGTGLGLAITKQFAEMMGGTVKVASEFGQGSTFTLHLPVQVVAKTPLFPMETLLKRHGIILIIDDDYIILELLQDYLGKLGYSVAISANGQDGLKLAKKLRPDAILLDVTMPQMDGWQVLTSLKQDSLLSDIPVIMMSVKENHELGNTLGATDYLVKPVSLEQLIAILTKHHLVDDSQGLVMVVEDDLVIRELLGEMLKGEGWRVFKAENGQVALEHLEDKHPALILLDLMMPEMDGFEFVTKLRSDDRWHSIPVVVFSGNKLTPEERARLEGVEIIFEKQNYSREELLVRIHEQMAVFAGK